MEGTKLWMTAFLLQSVAVSSLTLTHRRSMPAPAAPTILPLSKGGWRPVVGSGGLPGFGHFQAAPLHAQPTYKIPVPVLDSYPASSRPLVARDATKTTPIAQQYRPTTTRSLPASSPSALNQPINSYLNPFALQNGLSHYKIIQNYPMESVVIRNSHNPYMARPSFSKYPQKHKQSLNNAMLHHLKNVQQVQYGMPPYPTNKPHDVFSKPVEVYVRPSDSKKPQQFQHDPNAPEIFKPEVYKLADSDSSPQSVKPQQVKTAQQQQNLGGTLKPPPNIFQQYPYKDEKFSPLPPSVLGTFNPFGMQTVKGRDPVFPVTKTTYVPPVPSKQTIFNSFSFSPTYKTLPNQFLSTTPKLQSNYNHLVFGTNNDYRLQPPQQVKPSTPYKMEYGSPNKGSFKASPQDPFTKNSKHQTQNKHQHSNSNKLPQVTTYAPSFPNTSGNSYFIGDIAGHYPSQTNSQSAPFNSYFTQNYDNKKHKIQDSYTSNVNQPLPSQYPSPPKKQFEATANAVPFRATYDVTELYGEDIITHSSPHSWSPTPENHVFSTQQKPIPEEPVTKPEYADLNDYDKVTIGSNIPEKYEIVTESYGNLLTYDSNLDSPSRRPAGDDFQPIGKHKLKDYYYKVSTPPQDEFVTQNKRNKARPSDATIKPTESIWDYTTDYKINKDNNTIIENEQIESLPTLPPNQHFKRPNSQESLDKDKIRKRNKNRRRRPPQANRNHEKDEASTRRYVQSSTETYTAETNEIHTQRPRPRFPMYAKPKSTAPSVTTDLSTSALPTLSPTTPTTTIIKKKIRKPVTTPADYYETTTATYKENEFNRESPIMKIATRDYSHKQDEKDTPTSDISVSISDTTSRNRPESMKFSFHKDVKPIDAQTELNVKGLEKFNNSQDRETTQRTLTDSVGKANSEDLTEVVTTTPKEENNTNPIKILRPRLKNKFESSRPRFSVKDYRNRLSSTTTTEKSSDVHAPKLRFPLRRLPFQDNKYNSDNDNTTDAPRKKFTPKEPRYKPANTDDNLEITTEKESHSTRSPQRQRSTTETYEITQKHSSRIRSGIRRPKPSEEIPETSSQATIHAKRVIRKKVKDSDISETVQDITVTETTVQYDQKDDSTLERKKSESAIMKIAKDEKKHHTDNVDALFEQSKRVSDLTLAASKDYNTPGMFKAVSQNSRRVPSYFTIATDDPILPIEAFFPQLNQKKES